MPAHGLKGPRAQVVLQACAGLAPASGFENRLADAETPALEAEQVDATDNEVAPQIFRLDRLIVRAAHQRTDHCQMLPLNQRHLPRIAHAGAGAIARQAGLQPRFPGLPFDHWHVTFRAHANPAYAADLRYFGNQFLQWAHRLIPTSNTMLRPRLLRRKSGASG